VYIGSVCVEEKHPRDSPVSKFLDSVENFPVDKAEGRVHMAER